MAGQVGSGMVDVNVGIVGIGQYHLGFLGLSLKKDGVGRGGRI